MKKVKIDKKSIRPNPDWSPYKGTGWVEKMPGKITYKINLEGGISKEDFITMSKTRSVDGIDLSQTYVANIEFNQEMIDITSKYGPAKYLYTYKNPLIKCTECGNKIKYKSIIKKEYESCCDWREYEECPICEEEDSFNYQLEEVNDETLERYMKEYEGEDKRDIT